jgi:hypothetical protein
MKNMKLILESWKKLEEQTEADESDAKIEAGLKQAAAEIQANIENFKKEAAKVAQTKNVTKPQGELEESAILAAVGVGALIPLALKVIGSAIKTYHKYAGGETAEEMAKFFEESGEFVEKLFLVPLKPIASALVIASGAANKLPMSERPDFVEEKAEKVAEALFITAIAILAISSGVGAIHSFHSASLGHAFFESAMTAAKSGEIAKWLAEAISSLLKGAEAAGAGARVAAAGAAVGAATVAESRYFRKNPTIYIVEG